MKNKIHLTICLLALFGYSFGSWGAEKAVSEEKTVTVCCTPEVQNIAETFIQEYSKSNGNLNFEVKQVAPDRFSEEVNRENSLGFISEKANASQPKGLWKMLVARHIIVPVTHAENPNLAQLEERGISAVELQKSIGKNDGAAVNICVLEDESAAYCLTNFLGVDPASVANIMVSSKAEMIQKLQRDKTAIGFCCLLNVSDQNQDELAANFKILPIDKNENGRADYHETVYRPLSEMEKHSGNLTVHETAFGSLEAFERGIWFGKYPRSLVNDLYLVSAGSPGESEISKFIAWAITDGQQFIDGTDYNQLVYSERQSKLDDLQPREIIAGTAQQDKAATKSILYIIVGLIAIALILGMLVNFRKSKTKGLLAVFPGHTKVLNEENVEIPNGVYFDKTHTWSFMEKDGSVKVGIDDFMQQVTGEYTNVKMKNPGERIMKNEPLVTLVQDGKQIEIYAPISGKIKEINEDLVTDPSEINKSPYAEGWIYSIEPSNWQREIGFMNRADSYKSWMKREIERLKDFLAISVNAENQKQVAFQDGGELNNHVLKQFGPRVWEDFQKDFIDTAGLN